MKSLKIIAILLVVFTATTAFVGYNSEANPTPGNEELKWHTNFDDASALSQKQNKPIFAFFTGSDWCGWCRRLQATVFHKPSFKQWANENVVLLELDFPRRKQLPPEIAAQNNELKNFFQPRGYPTIWMFDMQLNQEQTQYEILALGSLGYPSGSQPGQEDKLFIANANKILANRK